MGFCLAKFTNSLDVVCTVRIYRSLYSSTLSLSQNCLSFVCVHACISLLSDMVKNTLGRLTSYVYALFTHWDLCFKVWISLLREETCIKKTFVFRPHGSILAFLWALNTILISLLSPHTLLVSHILCIGSNVTTHNVRIVHDNSWSLFVFFSLFVSISMSCCPTYM